MFFFGLEIKGRYGAGESSMCEVGILAIYCIGMSGWVELDSGIPKFNGVMSWFEKTWLVGRDINVGSRERGHCITN